MTATYTQRVEEEQIQQLGWVQELLTRLGIRTLLVRHLRLTLTPNRYDPPQRGGPVLIVGKTRVSVADGYRVEHDDGSYADFVEAEEAAAFVSARASRVF